MAILRIENNLNKNKTRKVVVFRAKAKMQNIIVKKVS